MWFNKLNKYNEIMSEQTRVYQKVVQLETDINSIKQQLSNVRAFINKKIGGKAFTSEEDKEENIDLQAIREAFGGSIPIELLEKYKNG